MTTFIGMQFTIDYSEVPILFTSVSPCRIVDTRKTSAGIIGASRSAISVCTAQAAP